MFGKCTLVNIQKVFKTFDNGVINQCQYFSGYLPIRNIIDLRRVKFYNSLKSSNDHVKLLYKLFGYKEERVLYRPTRFNLVLDCRISDIRSRMWCNFSGTFSFSWVYLWSFLFVCLSWCCCLLPLLGEINLHIKTKSVYYLKYRTV